MAAHIDRFWINKRLKEFNKGLIDFAKLEDGIAIDLRIRENPELRKELAQHLRMSLDPDNENHIETNADEIMSLIYDLSSSQDTGPIRRQAENLVKKIISEVETRQATFPKKFANYGWKIDKCFDDPSATGPMGPRAISPQNEAALIRGEGKKFGMYCDGESEPSYEGRYVGDGSMFEPLDDYGTPNYGCTDIKYFEGGTWVQI